MQDKWQDKTVEELFEHPSLKREIQNGTNFIEMSMQGQKSNAHFQRAEKDKKIQKGMHIAYKNALDYTGIQIHSLNDPDDDWDDFSPHQIPYPTRCSQKCNYCHCPINFVPIFLPHSISSKGHIILYLFNPFCSFRCARNHVFFIQPDFQTRQFVLSLLHFMARKYFGLKSVFHFVVEIKPNTAQDLIHHEKSHIRLFNRYANHYNSWDDYHKHTHFCTEPPIPFIFVPAKVGFETQYKVHQIKMLDERAAMIQEILDLEKAPIDDCNGSMPLVPEFDPKLVQLPESYPTDVTGMLCNYCHETICGIPIYKVEYFNTKRSKWYLDYAYPFCSFRCLITLLYEMIALPKYRWNAIENCLQFARYFFQVNRRNVHVKTKFILSDFNVRGRYSSWCEYENRTKHMECTMKSLPHQVQMEPLQPHVDDTEFMTPYQKERSERIIKAITPTAEQQKKYMEEMMRAVELKRHSMMQSHSQKEKVSRKERKQQAQGQKVSFDSFEP